MSPELLALFEPSGQALIDRLRVEIDDDMLRDLAAADGPFQIDANLAALLPIRRTGVVPAPLEWEPREVLELVHWSEPDDPKFHREPGEWGRLRAHLIRAFACSILLRAAADPASAGYILEENSTLVQLLSSALPLGRDVLRGTAQLVAWRLASGGENQSEAPFFELALLWSALFLNEPPFDDDVLVQLCDDVIASEVKVRSTLSQSTSQYAYSICPWLLGLTDFDLCHDVWRSVARRAEVEAQRLHNPATREKVIEISQLLLDEPA